MASSRGVLINVHEVLLIEEMESSYMCCRVIGSHEVFIQGCTYRIRLMCGFMVLTATIAARLIIISVYIRVLQLCEPL